MQGRIDLATVESSVSIIIPVFNSQSTLVECLYALERQTVQGFETILIDSSPSDACEHIVAAQFPSVRYEHVPHRMLPHAARNLGAQRASGAILVFSDPDVYASPNWLECMLAVHAQYRGVVIGSVECYGDSWSAIGIHLAKFDIFLPGGAIRQLPIAPTLNMLCPRDIFDAIGGFEGDHMIGDTIFGWDLIAKGYPITFAPEAVVDHHHTGGLGGLLKERYARGREFSQLRAAHFRWSRWRIAWQLLVTVLPLRWLNLVRRTLGASLGAGVFKRFLLTLPVVACGHAFWLLGEVRGLIDAF